MFKVGDKVITLRNAPDCLSIDLSNEPGVITELGLYKSKSAARVQLSDKPKYTIWFYINDIELLSKRLREGEFYCKCGAITSSLTLLCCDCRAKPKSKYSDWVPS